MVVVLHALCRMWFTGSGLHADSFALFRQTVLMSTDGDWYYDVRTKTVSQGKESGALDRMGPYPDRESAERAIAIAAERNKAADKADDDWNN